MNLSDKLKLSISEQQKVLELTTQFPDIKEHVNRWNRRRLSSKSVNALTVDAEISHNCGCCSDSPLEVWPYVDINGVRIFSDPAVFTVGEKSDYCGELEYDDWQEKLRKENIPQCVIDSVQKYFDSHSYKED